MADAIRKGMLVTISLVMADMTGRTLEETPPEGMVYLHGEGDIFPRLEKALEGHFAGEGFTIHLEPEEAFGEYDADAIRCIPVENFAHGPCQALWAPRQAEACKQKEDIDPGCREQQCPGARKPKIVRSSCTKHGYTDAPQARCPAVDLGNHQNRTVGNPCRVSDRIVCRNE